MLYIVCVDTICCGYMLYIVCVDTVCCGYMLYIVGVDTICCGYMLYIVCVDTVCCGHMLYIVGVDTICCDEWVKFYMWCIKKLTHKTLHVLSARYTQCVHRSSCKLKLPKDVHTNKVQTALPTHPFLKVQIYIVAKCKKIYRERYTELKNNDNRRKLKSHTYMQSNYGEVLHSTSASAHHTHLHWLSYLNKEMGFQWRSERLESSLMLSGRTCG